MRLRAQRLCWHTLPYRYSHSSCEAKPNRLPVLPAAFGCDSWNSTSSTRPPTRPPSCFVVTPRRNLWTSVAVMESEQTENVEQVEQGARPDRADADRNKSRAVEELLKIRTESEITIEATVDTGFEFMAIEECRDKFGQDFHVLKERGSIMFNIAKEKFPEVMKLRSVDNLYQVLSFDPKMDLKGTNSAEDVAIAKKQAHTPDWDKWLNVWKELSGFEGIVKPTPEQYAAANERATKDKEAEKIRTAERQKKYKERQERNAEKRAKRKAKADLLRAQRDAARKAAAVENKDEGANETSKAVDTASDAAADENIVEEKTDEPVGTDNIESELEKVSMASSDTQRETEETTLEDSASGVTTEVEGTADGADSEDEIQSLPDYEREIEREIDADVPSSERVLRFRATCFRVGKHSFGSMEVAREFGGELQDKFNWVVDLVNFNAEIVLFLFKDSAQVSIALTKRSLHRRNISFFGPTTLRSTVCHNLLRLADIQQGDIVLDPLAGGGSIPIEGAMSFPGTFHIGGDIHPKACSRFYSNVRCLQEEEGRELPIGTVRWDSRRLPLNEGSVDVIVTDLPFGVRLGSKTSNRNLYQRVLLEMARVARPGKGRAILLTQDRKSFSMALVNTMGLWWQSKVMSANIGGLDAAVFTLRRTAKIRPDEAELAAAAAQAKERGSWREGPYTGGHGHRGRGGQRGRGRGGGRGRPYPRGNRQSNNSGNWRDAGKNDGAPNPTAAI
ncbi:uncharacterized protein LOC117644159 [Thrips palmi]|uniref:Uncharacterized protein LOC117644159 n=1 Tax=Thrips palmi TaxID=161013 RepID=A0A6P8YPZ2_THRPL|nr:uncharacterized protein LOC117644159 [Thrips palmi]